MAEFSELVQALTWLVTNRIQQKIEYTRGLLGDGNGRVRVTTIPGSPEVDYVYVRPDRFANRTFKVFNKRIEGQDGDPIIIGELPWEPGLIQVVDMDWPAYSDVGWGDDVTTVNRHGAAHQWRDGAPGIDTFNVYRRQFGDLKTYATESGTLSVGVSPYSLDIYGSQYQWPGTQTFDLAGALPTTTGTARMALVYWSPASGTTQGFLGVATGTLGSGAEATILNRPASPEGVIPSAFVRLAGGQSSITEFDIYDAREPFRPGILFGTGTAGLSADKIPISDNSGLYTGSTVEAALDQIGFDGARVSKIYRSNFSAVALESDANANVTINGTGTFTIPSDVIHAGDTDTKISLTDDAISFDAGGLNLLKLTETTQDLVEIGDVAGTGDVDININSGQMFIEGSTGDTKFGSTAVGTGENVIFQGQSGTQAAVGFYTGDGDGTDNNTFAVYLVGTPGSISPRERLLMQGIAGDQFRLRSDAGGGGTVRPLVLETGSNTDQLHLAIDSNVGVNVDDPQGSIHSYNAISGFLLWEYDGLDATVRTIIPNGTGDVLYRLHAEYVLRDSAGAVASGSTDVSNTASVNLTVGTNTVRLRVNADGSCDTSRTAGTDTIKVAYTLRWL